MSIASPQAGRSARQHLVIIFLSRTVLSTAQRIIYPFLPSIARGLGITLQAATGLVTFRLAAGLAAPFLGPLGDHVGRRRTMETGLIVFTVAGLLLAGVGTSVSAAIAFLMYGLSKVLYDPAAHAYVGDSVPYAKRGRAIGFVELSWSCAWLIGVPVSGFLIERLGWRAPWAVLSALGILCIWITYARLQRAADSPGHPHPQRLGNLRATRIRLTVWAQFAASILTTLRQLLRQHRVVILLLTSFLLSLAIETPFIVYGVWLENAFGLGLATLGLASIVVGLAEATAELGTTVITDRLGKRRSMLLGLLGLAASLLALPWLSQLGLGAALAGVALMILTFEFTIVSLLPLATELVPTARASLLSLNMAAFSLGRMLGALLGGWLWKWQATALLPVPFQGHMALNALIGAGCTLVAVALLGWGLRGID